VSGWWIAALLVAAAYGLYRAFYVEPNRLVLERRTVPVPGLPPGLDGLEVVHLSDLHLGGRVGDREHRLVEAVRSLRAPVLVFTGDFLEEDGALGNLVPLLMEMTRDKRVFAVLGNADYARPRRTERLVAVLEGAGVTLLRNRAVTLSAQPAEGRRGGKGGVANPARGGEEGGAASHDGRLWLVGIDDPVTGRADLDQAFAEVEPGGPVVALVHSPDAALPAIARGASLVLCGHTHGGQINVPLLGPVHTATRVGRRLARGLVPVPGGSVYVNRGVGMTRIAARFLCPPEIAVLTLVRGEEEATPAAD